MDNIYIIHIYNIYINYIINKQLGKRKKIVVMFVGLKAAFDSVDRGVLVKTMRERGIREGLVERVGKVLGETRSRVRVGGETGECFWTAKGVRQRCPLSPLLFNIMTADLEEEMGKVKWGGIRILDKRVYTLAYPDDIMLLSKDEEGMKSMIGRLEEYLKKKKLELNVEKTKIMRFRKGGGRLSKREWRWKGRKIEEVKKFTYLGYRLQRNGGQEAQVRERIKKAAMIVAEV